MRPLDFDDLVSELPCGDHLRWSAGGFGELQAEIEEREQHRKLVCRGVPPFLQQLEHLLGESDSASNVGWRHPLSQYAALAGITQRMPPRGSPTSPRPRGI